MLQGLNSRLWRLGVGAERGSRPLARLSSLIGGGGGGGGGGEGGVGGGGGGGGGGGSVDFKK